MMKKLFCIALIALTTYTVHAQFTAGVSGGLPIGDSGDIALFSIAVDLGYLFDLDDNLSAGPITGFSHSFGDDLSITNPVTGDSETIKYDDISFLPTGARIRFDISEVFTLGADLGYAFGISEGEDGGFYYSPKVQYSISDLIDIVLAYRGIAKQGASFDIISFGFEFGID